MKTASKFSILFALTIFAFACSSPDKGTEVEAQDATEEAAEVTTAAMTYNINPSTSIINWKGYKTFNIGDAHTGVISLNEGTLAVTGDNLSAGNFTIDMASIDNQDLEAGEGKEDLEGHLKSEDFFAVDQYPTATFEITGVEAVENSTEATHTITGNLTMRGETKQISIPANVTMSEGKLTAVAPEFTIDRTQWNVMYNSDKLEGIAKEKLISNDLTLQITLNATASES